MIKNMVNNKMHIDHKIKQFHRRSFKIIVFLGKILKKIFNKTTILLKRKAREDKSMDLN